MMIVIERTQMSSLIRHYSIVKQFDRHSSSRTFFSHSLLQKTFKPRHSSPCIVEMETEIEQLKRENEALKRENAELKLNSAIQQLFDTRQQLLNVQDRLTVTEQVTAATQRRQLVQEGLYENLPPHSVYEKLRFDPAQEHVYAKLQTHRGCIIFDLISCHKFLL